MDLLTWVVHISTAASVGLASEALQTEEPENIDAFEVSRVEEEPDQVILSVPYRSQNEASERNDCGETVLAMLYEFNTGERVDIDRLNALHPGEALRTIQQLREVDDLLGHDFTFWAEYSPEYMWQWNLLKGQPVGTYIQLDNRVDHWVVVYGMEKAGEDNWIFYYHDPLRGAEQQMTSSEFAERTPKGYWGITF